jgi:hypothetical protein
MKLLRPVFFVMLMASLMLGQSSPPATNPSPDPTARISDQIKSLQDAIAQQQKQIEMLQQQLAEQKDAQAKMVNATYTAPSPATTAAASDVQEPAKESPLSFRIGGAEFTPGGFVDFENIFRSTNTTNAAATSFGGIPFSDSVQGHLSEFRITGQYSRLSMRIDTTFKENKVRAYIEGDLNGNDAATVFQTTNPHTARLRLYWLDLKRGQWEFLGGQSWGLLTPNRTGLSPMPSDLALTLGEDANVHVGVNHSRAGTFRAVWHPNDNFAWGIGIENPQQFVGSEVTFPTAFAAGKSNLTGQFDNGVTAGIPNVGPDINTKLAWDSDPLGRHFHFELGGMMTTVKTSVLPTVAGSSFSSHSKVGGGIESAVNFELIKNVRLLANGLYGNGVGRYMIALAPTAVVRPIVDGTGFDAQPSLVHAANGTVGVELQAGPKSQFGFYYGGMYAKRNFFGDLTAGGAGPCAGKPCIGFGGPNSSNTNNRAIQEGTIDWNQTFWRNPQYGAVLLIAQYSYLTRAPWFVAKDPISGALLAPKNAHLSMGFLSIRYVLP